MLYSINDVCKIILEDYGEPMSPYWLASQMVEARMWKANECEVRVALDEEIEKFGESAWFIKTEDDEYSLREWEEQ
ncbi:hypothetical protein MNBD_PLANCTO02-588 [hydrothermal vent metagenome]|uniref:HTH HARE-type domain-containing protein n=1 Tax=hydrothermal vent metagenome TaxID=652676 RepID=A0A3B1DM96_9ZZZZ